MSGDGRLRSPAGGRGKPSGERGGNISSLAALLFSGHPSEKNTHAVLPFNYSGVAEVSLLFPITRAELDVQNKKYFV